MANRLFFIKIRAHDKENDTNYVRELEMLVESCNRDRGIILQFWRDMNVYGLREAILYLRQSKGTNFAEIAKVEALAERLCNLIRH